MAIKVEPLERADAYEYVCVTRIPRYSHLYASHFNIFPRYSSEAQKPFTRGCALTQSCI